jgi:hypothetical protein
LGRGVPETLPRRLQRAKRLKEIDRAWHTPIRSRSRKAAVDVVENQIAIEVLGAAMAESSTSQKIDF